MNGKLSTECVSLGNGIRRISSENGGTKITRNTQRKYTNRVTFTTVYTHTHSSEWRMRAAKDTGHITAVCNGTHSQPKSILQHSSSSIWLVCVVARRFLVGFLARFSLKPLALCTKPAIVSSTRRRCQKKEQKQKTRKCAIYFESLFAARQSTNHTLPLGSMMKSHRLLIYGQLREKSAVVNQKRLGTMSPHTDCTC